jgi:hypothetical protein
MLFITNKELAYGSVIFANFVEKPMRRFVVENVWPFGGIAIICEVSPPEIHSPLLPGMKKYYIMVKLKKI